MIYRDELGKLFLLNCSIPACAGRSIEEMTSEHFLPSLSIMTGIY